MYLVIRFGTTDYCVGMHSSKVNGYSNILLLYLCYNSVINIINDQNEKRHPAFF